MRGYDGYGGAAFQCGPLGLKRGFTEGGLMYEEHQAPFGISMKLPFFHRRYSVFHTDRKRLNANSILIAIFAPWLLFCFVFLLMSFSMHYFHRVDTYLIVCIAFVLSVGGFGLLAYTSQLRRAGLDEDHVPMWHGFLCATCFLAVVVGAALGWYNFASGMSQIYGLRSLATYRNIEPAQYVGQQLVDAGLVLFNDQTHLDITKSMAFMDADIYCVAPIVSPKTSPTTFVDFWAVGKNCCSGKKADFHCTGYRRIKRMGGTRLMNDDDRPFYRLAVQQAEATYGIRTRKPIFFIWGDDPIRHASVVEYNAHLMYLCGICAALCVQCFLVMCAALVFVKIFPRR